MRRANPSGSSVWMRRKWTTRALLVVGSSCVALVLAEAALWLFFPVPYREFLKYETDGRIGARPTPHQAVHDGEGHEIRINHLGFRGPDWDFEPAPGTLRLLAFGGSSTFSFFAGGLEATWPSRLSHYLEQELGLPVEVLNLGVPGYNATHSKVNYLFLGSVPPPPDPYPAPGFDPTDDKLGCEFFF